MPSAEAQPGGRGRVLAARSRCWARRELRLPELSDTVFEFPAFAAVTKGVAAAIIAATGKAHSPSSVVGSAPPRDDGSAWRRTASSIFLTVRHPFGHRRWWAAALVGLSSL